MSRKYIVVLSEEQREYLEKRISSGTTAARSLTRARILLKADSGPCGPQWTDDQIRIALDVSDTTIATVRKSFVQEGLPATLRRKKPDRKYERCLDGEAEAHLIALACGQPPEGRQRWTLRLLAEQMVALEYVEHISYETVRIALKKTSSSPG